MSRFSKTPSPFLLLPLLLAALPAWGADPLPGIGRPATAAEIKAWDIDVRPDFKGLPKGKGSVAQGELLFEEKCASCHGTFGESNEVFTPLIGGTTPEDIKTGRVAGFVRGDIPQRTTFTKVATLSTVYDYIQRAMPWTSPKSLTPDETYATLAYLLHLAEIIPADFTLSDLNIAEVQQRMPNRHGMTTDHGFWPGRGMGNGGKPDVRNTACMKNCKPEAKISSVLPEYARAAHGELYEQNRSFGAVRGTRTLGEATPAPATTRVSANLDLATRSGCMACHSVDSKRVGPGYNEIRARYKDQPDAESRLTAKVKTGGQGAWGSVPMPAHPQLADTDLTTLVRWILSGTP